MSAVKMYPAPWPAQDKEISTIIVNRREYRVEINDNDRMPYILHGKRGATYGLFRNMNHPEQLFAMTPGGVTPRTMWFRERDGKLVVSC